MFYIKKNSALRKKDLAMMHIGPTLVVFAAFFGLTVWSWLNANRTIQQKQSDLLTQQVQETQLAIQSRLDTYDNVMRAATGLFGASDNVSRQEWEAFVNVFDLDTRYPGASSVGYAQSVSGNQLKHHLQAQQTQNSSAYHIFPKGSRELYVPVVYTDSTTDMPRTAVGYDLHTDPSRGEALDQARDTGNAVITPPLKLLQNATGEQPPGFLIFMPIYSHGSAPNSVVERRARIQGFVFMTFRSQDLISKAVPDDNSNFGFEIFSGSTTSTPLYQNPNNEKIVRSDKHWTITQTFSVENTQWTIAGSIGQDALPKEELNRPAGVLWGGMLFSIFVAGFIYLLLLNRTRLLADREAGEIQDAKDELLALASHQLRTPATGVKQYIGMLREGFAGQLTEEQQGYVEKAYHSNERQLGTINEMLVVARADAGHLELEKTNLDLNELVSDVIDEQLGSINSRQQAIESYVPKQHLHIHADKHYLRMAIENILSNATKYTPEHGKIMVTVLQKKNVIHISIRDTGVGVSKHDEALLFQKFSRIPNELTSKVGGSGIGLYLAQKIIAAHHGKITFKSIPTEGSVFTIIVPVRDTTT